MIKFKSIISNFHLTGEPILLHLLRYSTFVVKYHNFMRCALHLRPPRLVNNPRPPELFIKIADKLLQLKPAIIVLQGILKSSLVSL